MSRNFIAISAALCALYVSACATIIEGTSQEIVVNTNPDGADCALTREGLVIARVNPTPASTTIKKTKEDITIVCEKAGYQQATFINHSDAAGATFGNIIAGGLVGWAVDSASGSDNKYTSPVNITLVPVSSGAPAQSSEARPYTPVNANQPGS